MDPRDRCINGVYGAIQMGSTIVPGESLDQITSVPTTLYCVLRWSGFELHYCDVLVCVSRLSSYLGAAPTPPFALYRRAVSLPTLPSRPTCPDLARFAQCRHAEPPPRYTFKGERRVLAR